MQTPTDNSDVRYALIAVGLWSSVAVAFKLGLSVLTPIQLLTVAVAIATLFFITLGLVTGRLMNKAALATLGSGQGLRSAALGLLNPLAYYLVLFGAYDRLPAQIAQPLNFTWSITLALLAVPLLGQPLSGKRALGIAVSYFGVLIILTPYFLVWRCACAVEHVGLGSVLAAQRPLDGGFTAQLNSRILSGMPNANVVVRPY